MSEALEARIAELEIKLSYTDDLIETLNHSVFRQQEQIEQLQLALRALREQRQSDEVVSPPRDPREEMPPHY